MDEFGSCPAGRAACPGKCYPQVSEVMVDLNLDSWYKVIRNRMKQSVNADHSVSEATASPISLDKSIRFDRLAHL